MSTKPPDAGTVTSAQCNLEDVHALQNISSVHSAGNFGNLKLGQVIAALIANVSEMSFTSSLDLGCLPGNWGTLFSFPLDTKPQISQLCRSAGIGVSFFFFFSLVE